MKNKIFFFLFSLINLKNKNKYVKNINNVVITCVVSKINDKKDKLTK